MKIAAIAMLPMALALLWVIVTSRADDDDDEDGNAGAQCAECAEWDEPVEIHPVGFHLPGSIA